MSNTVFTWHTKKFNNSIVFKVLQSNISLCFSYIKLWNMWHKLTVTCIPNTESWARPDYENYEVYINTVSNSYLFHCSIIKVHPFLHLRMQEECGVMFAIVAHHAYQLEGWALNELFINYRMVQLKRNIIVKYWNRWNNLKMYLFLLHHLS